MDIDGVLTSGEIIVLNSGEEIKIWSVKDRMGFALLKNSGLSIKLAWVTARESRQVEERSKEIGVDYLFQKCLNKWERVSSCARRLNLQPDQIAYIGDDLVDLKALKNVGLAVCPPESPKEIKEVCDFQTTISSGKGVAREVIEILIKAQGQWQAVLSKFSIFLIAILLTLSACSPHPNSTSSIEKPDQWIEKFTITETRNGIPIWILQSEMAQVYNKQKKATLDQISIQFMNPPKELSSKSLILTKKSQTLAARLSAPKGEVNLDSHNLLVWNGVKVQSEDGTTLYSEQLRYSTDKQKIFTEAPIKIVKKDSILIGEGLEADPDLSTVKIFRHEASIHPKTILNP